MINLYYDRFENKFPVPNGCKEYSIVKENIATPYVTDQSPVHPVTMFYFTMLAEGTDVEFSDTGYYPIELSFHSQKNIISFIPRDTIRKLSEKKIKLLLLYQEEGADIHTAMLVKKVADSFLFEGVPEDNIYIVLGDLNIAYKEFLLPYKTFGIDWWQVKHKLTCLSRYNEGEYLYTSFRNYDSKLSDEQKQIETFDIDTWTNPSKKFLCYNGNNRIHRLGLVSEILTRNLLNQGYLSYNIYTNSACEIQSDDARIVDKKKPSKYLQNKINSIEWLNSNKLYIDYKSNTFWNDDRRYNAKHYKNTLFSIVTETYAGHTTSIYPQEQNVLWTTEKTWKPVAIGHPFMILGSVGTIEYLRSEGYKTFDMLFDESYDQETNMIKRIEMICNNIEKATQENFEEVKHVVKYNKQLFYTKKHRDKFYNLFREMNNG